MWTLSNAKTSLQMAMFQTVTSAFIDEFDWLKNKKLWLTAGLCLFEFLMGIPCVTRVGFNAQPRTSARMNNTTLQFVSGSIGC